MSDSFSGSFLKFFVTSPPLDTRPPLRCLRAHTHMDPGAVDAVAVLLMHGADANTPLSADDASPLVCASPLARVSLVCIRVFSHTCGSLSLTLDGYTYILCACALSVCLSVCLSLLRVQVTAARCGGSRGVDGQLSWEEQCAPILVKLLKGGLSSPRVYTYVYTYVYLFPCLFVWCVYVYVCVCVCGPNSVKIHEYMRTVCRIYRIFLAKSAGSL